MRNRARNRLAEGLTDVTQPTARPASGANWASRFPHAVSHLLLLAFAFVLVCGLTVALTLVVIVVALPLMSLALIRLL